MVKRLPLAFAGICIAIGVLLSVRIWKLHLLYTDADVRSVVERTLRNTADRKGWLISDMAVAEVTSARVTIHYRRHSLRRDPATCYHLTLVDSSLTPCE